MASVMIPGWFFWLSIAMYPIVIAVTALYVLSWSDWSKWCPEGVAMKYARKHGGYVKFEHYPSDEGEISLGKVEKVKGKGMLQQNWFGKTSVRFIPEEGTNYVEHLPGGLQIIHYVGTHPGPKRIMGVRAVRQMAEMYPSVFSETNPHRRVAYRFLTVPELEVLRKRPHEVQEHVAMWNEVQKIKAKITGAKTIYHIKDEVVQTLADTVDLKKYRKEPIGIEDFMEVVDYIPEETEEDLPGNPESKFVTTGKILISEIANLILAPDTVASVANAFSIIESNTRRKEMNKQSELMGIGFLVIMVCVGVGVLLYLLMTAMKGGGGKLW